MNLKKRISLTSLYVVLIIGLVIFALPYVYMIISSTQSNDVIVGAELNFKFGPHFWTNLLEVQTKYNYVRVLINTMVITVIGTVISTFITTLAGYVMAKYKFKGSKLIFNLVMISRMVPQFAMIIPIYFIMSKLGLTNTFAGVIIPALASTNSVFIMRQYALQVPDEMLEAPRIDGASEWTIFTKVVIPSLIPSIVTVGMLTFMTYWNAYLLPLVMLKDNSKFTVPLIIQNMTQNPYDFMNYGALMVILATSVIPIVCIYMYVQSKYKSTGMDSAIK